LPASRGSTVHLVALGTITQRSGHIGCGGNDALGHSRDPIVGHSYFRAVYGNRTRGAAHVVEIRCCDRDRAGEHLASADPCMDYRFINSFSKRTKLSKAAYERVVARWQELGLSGTPPVVSVFEDE
jgi:hypothetical protein